MAKAKKTNRKGSKENALGSEPEFVVQEASIKNGLLNYSHKMLKGPTTGFTHKTTGKGIIMPSLQDSFNEFRKHLAVIDEVFKHSGIEIGDVDQMENHELVNNYTVTGIKLKGDEGAESVSIIGSKYTGLGNIDITTPQIAIGELSSYTWYNELTTCVINARREVEAYMAGNFEQPEEDEKPKYKQTMLGGELLDDGIDKEMEEAVL